MICCWHICTDFIFHFQLINHYFTNGLTETKLMLHVNTKRIEAFHLFNDKDIINAVDSSSWSWMTGIFPLFSIYGCAAYRYVNIATTTTSVIIVLYLHKKIESLNFVYTKFLSNSILKFDFGPFFSSLIKLIHS